MYITQPVYHPTWLSGRASTNTMMKFIVAWLSGGQSYNPRQLSPAPHSILNAITKDVDHHPMPVILLIRHKD